MPPARPTELRCEYLKNPLGVATAIPRFAWTVESKVRAEIPQAFQIIIASDRARCESEVGDIWDSGRVESARTYGVEYSGEPLLSVTRYFWRVRWWDGRNEVSPWSETATFGTAFLTEGEWRPKWISLKSPREFRSQGNLLLGEEVPPYIQTYAICLRKEVKLREKAVRATAYICGLGYYELWVNGAKAGDRVLEPAWTDYKKTSLYSVLDITELIKPQTAFAVILGSGRHIKNFGYDQPRLACQIFIEYADGEYEILVADETWKAGHGPLQENGLYHGERYDARFEKPGWDRPGFDDSGWENAVSLPSYPLGAQMLPPIRVVDVLKPKSLSQPKPGVWVFDFGQNFSGWARLRVDGPRGTEVRLRHAELLSPDGTLNTRPNENAAATDVYILKGGGPEVYEPRFTYHGFRFVEVTGFPGQPTPEALEGCFVHSDVEQSASFTCSDPLFNQIHQNVKWGLLSNLMSIPTDCPQRDERHGWLGDAHLAAEAAIYNFDMAAFYLKFLEDIRMAQREDGSLPDFVPPYVPRTYPADPAWGAAYAVLVWCLYWYYGDTRVIQRHYGPLKKYVDFLTKNAEDHLLKALGKYGDWCPPGSVMPKKTPVELTSTWYYFHDVLYLSRLAQTLGRVEDVKAYGRLAEEIKSAFNAAYLEEDQYAALRVSRIDKSPNQTSNLLPLYLDMVPEPKKKAVLGKLLDSITRQSDGHVDTGIIGTRYLLDVLTENGHPEVAYQAVAHTSYPGWGYMVKEGATTLWERWELLAGNGMNSHNHAMFGSVDSWFYRAVAGLSPSEPGWEKIRVAPRLVRELTSAEATVRTPRGTTRTAWRREEKAFHLEVLVPVGAKASIHLPLLWPKVKASEGGHVLWDKGEVKDNVQGLSFVGPEDGGLVIRVESGSYTFVLTRAD